MHSSRMRTARLLPVSPSMHCSGGITWSSGGVPAGGYLVLGVYLVLGGVPGLGVYLVLGGCTWFPGGVPGPGGGVYLVPGDVPGPRGVPGLGGVPAGGCTWSRGVPDQVLPPVDRMLDTRF